MPYRIRARADGELEVEVDTPSEVQQLLHVVLPGSPRTRPFLLGPGPAVIDAMPDAEVPARPRRRRRRGGRRARRDVSTAGPSRHESREAPAASARSLADDDLLAILKRGPIATGEIAKQLRVPRHRVTEQLNGLASRALAHATGATLSRRWHHGPAAPAKAPDAPRRSL